MPWSRIRDAFRARRTARGKSPPDVLPTMNPSAFRRCGAAVLTALAFAVAVPAPRAAAQAPPPSREELLLQWDLDHNGTVDAAEAEIAKSRMRRSRNEAARNSGVDPLTGKPRAKIDPLTGRSVQPEGGRGEDDDLILVPGNGERPGRTSRSKTDDDDESMNRPRSSDRPALPGTRAPQTESLVPSVRPRDLVPTLPGAAGRGPGTGPVTGPSRGSGPPSPGGPGGTAEQLRGQLRPPAASAAPERPSPSGPGVISGGLRGGAAPTRPGYGGSGAGSDLNAGRLPGGLPQVRGRPAGTAVGGAPGQAAGPGTNAAAGQPTGRAPLNGRAPPTGPAPLVGGSRPLPPQGSAPGTAAGLRSGAVQPPRQTPPAAVTRPPTTRPLIPRTPGGGPDDFFGR